MGGERLNANQAEAAARKLAHLLLEGGSEPALAQMLADGCFWVGVDGSELTLPVARRAGKIVQEQYHTVRLGENQACVSAWLVLTSPQDKAPAKKPGQPMCITMVMQLAAQRWKAVHLHASLLPPGGPGERDRWLSDLRQTQERTERLRAEDPLTGILNLDGFVKAVRRLQKTDAARPHAFIQFTINRFRFVNQIYGYDFGDEVLCSVARSVGRACGPGEVCCRVEKDNFAMLWLFKDRAQLQQRMDSLRERLLDKKILARMEHELTFSAAVYLPAPGSAEPVKEMLDKTLAVLREMQGIERNNRVDYVLPQVFEKRKYQGRLLQQAAAAMQDGQFQLYIQPQVDIKSGRVVSGEALARWRKADGTLLLPGSFIPLFEEDGTILEFDYHMAELLCRHMRGWMDEGTLIFPISINQSRLHVHETEYLERFVGIVDRWGIPHRYLAFELTESAFVQEREKMFRLAQQLHRLGFQLQIDDFGTGYTSLNLIGLLAADVLKIDKSLLDGMECTVNRRGCKVLQKVIEMAHETEMTVVCEGVETAVQAQMLCELGCDIAQGFYYYRPMPADRFVREILKKQPRRLPVGDGMA